MTFLPFRGFRFVMNTFVGGRNRDADLATKIREREEVFAVGKYFE